MNCRLSRCALGLAACVSGSALAHAQPATASRAARTTGSTSMTTSTLDVAPPPIAPVDTSIRPFKVHFSDEALADLRRRVRAGRFSDMETVPDQSQGVQLKTLQALARYWGNDYDWRKVETRLNALPQFITNIDGLDIHFIQVKSKHPNAMPLIITHGWPGSIIEQLKVIEPLTNPTAYGGKAEDAFDVVIPSLPGFGFSGKPTTVGWEPARMASAFAVLMKRLGYTRYVAQGGDWGSLITDLMGVQAPPGLLGIHNSMPARGTRRHRPGDAGRCAGARRSVRRRATCVRRAVLRVEARVLRVLHGVPSTDIGCLGGFARRPRELPARS